MRFIILSLLLASQAVMAADVVHLKLNQPAPMEGYLFSIPKELEVRKAMMELDTSKLLLDNNAKLINLMTIEKGLLTEQVRLWQDQSRELSRQLVEKENARLWWFLGGAALTTALAFAVNKAVK